jgi:hypothetical protein
MAKPLPQRSAKGWDVATLRLVYVVNDMELSKAEFIAFLEASGFSEEGIENALETELTALCDPLV